MSEGLRRARLQIHLSTAVLMMFVAGGLIWANVKERSPYETTLVDYFKALFSLDEPLEMYANPAKSPNPILWDKGHGWPKVAYYRPDKLFAPAWEPDRPQKYEWFAGMACVDFGVAWMILVATWFLSEWVIRRKRRS